MPIGKKRSFKDSDVNKQATKATEENSGLFVNGNTQGPNKSNNVTKAVKKHLSKELGLEEGKDFSMTNPPREETGESKKTNKRDAKRLTVNDDDGPLDTKKGEMTAKEVIKDTTDAVDEKEFFEREDNEEKTYFNKRKGVPTQQSDAEEKHKNNKDLDTTLTGGSKGRSWNQDKEESVRETLEELGVEEDEYELHRSMGKQEESRVFPDGPGVTFKAEIDNEALERENLPTEGEELKEDIDEVMYEKYNEKQQGIKNAASELNEDINQISEMADAMGKDPEAPEVQVTDKHGKDYTAFVQDRENTHSNDTGEVTKQTIKLGGENENGREKTLATFEFNHDENDDSHKKVYMSAGSSKLDEGEVEKFQEATNELLEQMESELDEALSENEEAEEEQEFNEEPEESQEEQAQESKKAKKPALTQ